MESVSIQPSTFSAETTWADSWFRDLPTDLRFQKVVYHTYLPMNSLKNADSILFSVPMWSSGSYFMLDKALINIRLHVEGPAEGSVVATDSKAGFTNNIMHTLFEDVKFSMNDQNIFPNSGNAHYKAYLHNLLNFPEDCKSSSLQSQGWYGDTTGFMNTMGSTNSGWILRQALFSSLKASKREYNNNTIQFVGPFLSDFSEAQQVVNGVGLKFEFSLNKNSRIFMADAVAAPRVVVESMELLIPSAELSSDMHLKVERLLNSKSFDISYRRKEIQIFQIPASSSIYLTDNLWLNKTLPSRLFIQFVKTTAYLGNYAQNCFEFVRDIHIDSVDKTNNCSISCCDLFINGSLADGLASSEMMDFYRFNETLQLNDSPFSNHLSLADYNKGNCIFGFDLTTSHNATLGLVVPATRKGNLRLSIGFSIPTTETLTGILFTESPSVISIDKSRRVSVNYLS